MRLNYSRTPIHKKSPARALILAISLITPLISNHSGEQITRVERIAESIEQEDPGRIEKMLESFNKKGATNEQVSKLKKIAKKITSLKDLSRYGLIILNEQKKTREALKEADALTILEKMVGMPNFQPDMIDTIAIIVSKDHKINYALKAVSTILGNPDAKDTILNFSVGYAKVKDIVLSVGADCDDVIICLNFAYGIALLGEEKTRELYYDMGIEYFARYSKETLSALQKNLDESGSNRPVLLALFNKNDHNGAFYNRGRKLDSLTKYYRVFIVESSEEEQLYRYIENIGKIYGKIAAGVIAGHGEKTAVQFGNEEKGSIDLSDEEELADIKRYFIETPIIVFDSCSTGEDETAIAGLVSRILFAKVFAPIAPNSETTYYVDDYVGITNVTYDVPHNLFEDGIAMIE